MIFPIGVFHFFLQLVISSVSNIPLLIRGGVFLPGARLLSTLPMACPQRSLVYPAYVTPSSSKMACDAAGDIRSFFVVVLVYFFDRIVWLLLACRVAEITCGGGMIGSYTLLGGQML